MNAASEKEQTKKITNKKMNAVSKKNLASTKASSEQPCEDSESEGEENLHLISDVSDTLSEDLELSNSVNVNFVRRNVINVQKRVEEEKLYIIAYFNHSKTKLYVGKIKTIDTEKNLLLTEFMDQKDNSKFVWKATPPREMIFLEQVIIGPLSVRYDHGIYVNGLPKAKEMYINYINSLSAQS